MPPNKRGEKDGHIRAPSWFGYFDSEELKVFCWFSELYGLFMFSSKHVDSNSRVSCRVCSQTLV